MSLPSAAAAPVSGARRPILMGPPCAGAVRGAASDAASATLRTAASVRTWMRVIGGAPLHRLASDGGPQPRDVLRLARPLLRSGGGRAHGAPRGSRLNAPSTPRGANRMTPM